MPTTSPARNKLQDATDWAPLTCKFWSVCCTLFYKLLIRGRFYRERIAANGTAIRSPRQHPPFAERNVMERLGLNHSALMPANLTTLAHFSASAATKAPNSAALRAIGMVPA